MHHSYYRAFRRIAAIGSALLLTLAAHAALAADPTAATPPAASAPAPLTGNHYQGNVTSVDATAKTFVIQTRFSETPVTIKMDTAATVKAMKNVGLEGLKVGDHVMVQGQVSPDQGTITARQIRLLPADSKAKTRVSVRAAIGTVSTLTPALTLSLDDGKTIAVTTGDRVRVMAPQDAEFSDIAVGNQVDVMGTADGTAFTATSVMITSPRPRRAAPETTATPAPAGTPAPAPDPVKPGPDPLAKP